MTYPYPPQQPPKKLERSRNNKVLGGVCGGIADYFNMDPTLVRVLTVIIAFFTGVPIILYLIALFVIPEADPNRPPQGYPPVNGPQEGYNPYAAYPPQADVAPGAPVYQPAPGSQGGTGGFGGTASSGDEAIWGQEGAPWEQRESAAPAPTPAPEGTSTWETTPAEPVQDPPPSNDDNGTDSSDKRL
jgi:phage shock protein C